jgi:hypothetical protein
VLRRWRRDWRTRHRPAYLGALLACARPRSAGDSLSQFAFVTYGISRLWGHSFRLIEVLGGPTAIFFYGLITGTLVLIALVALARRFGRDE